MSEEIEKQVSRACAQLSEKLRLDSTTTTCTLAAEIMRDLLAGKFKEEMPEIAGFSTRLWIVGTLHQTMDELSWYVSAELGGLKILGPYRATKIGAIKAWNEACEALA